MSEIERRNGKGLWSTMRALAYASPLYTATLTGRLPAGLMVIPSDSWPGDPVLGQAIVENRFILRGRLCNLEAPQWTRSGPDPAWTAELNGFTWLRHLRDLGGNAARRRTRDLIAHWIGHNSRWHEISWQPDVLADRVAIWIGLHDFYLASADDGFRDLCLESLVMQLRHLSRVAEAVPASVPMLSACRSLVLAGVVFPDEDNRLAAMLGQGLRLLELVLGDQILSDGGHVSRSPTVHMKVLRTLIDVRTALRAGRREIPDWLHRAISAMAPVLRMLRHGDGGLAVFNGGDEQAPWMIDAVIGQAETRGPIPTEAPALGYQRLSAHRTLVVLDSGRPCPTAATLDYGLGAHAGTLAFEMSIGKERLIVNCGASTLGSEAWHMAQRATAAHTTLVLNDHNSSEIKAEGAVGRIPPTVQSRRYPDEEGVIVTATHDGYLESFDCQHLRALQLSTTGTILMGEDRITGPRGQAATLRFHLHPRVSAALIGRESIILRLPSGMGWRFVCDKGDLALEDSVYFGSGNEMRRSQQIVVQATTTADDMVLSWRLSREDRSA